MKEQLPHLDEVLEFRHSLSEETDRGCALMAAAYLSDQLERLLRSTFVDDPAAADEIFRPSGPLGSFSAKINVALLVGLLPRNAHHDLDLIRRIRNEFGHVARPLNFEETPIADRCRELSHTVLAKDAPSRHRFTNAVMGVTAIIHAQLAVAHHMEAPRDVVRTERQKKVIRGAAEKVALDILTRLEDA
jgi:DNA-binding MltR family transcriptional regulator